jgi:hypothetical protein
MSEGITDNRDVNRNHDDAGKPGDKVPQHKKAPWWRDGRAIAPIAISVLALIFAGLTYVDQHNVDVAAVTASQEAYARLVSYYQSAPGFPGSYTMVIQNLGQQPIFNVQAQIVLVHYNKTAQTLAATFELPFELPPCSDTTVNFSDPGLLGSLEKYSVMFKDVKSNSYNWVPVPFLLVFTDANQRAWEINTLGTLTEVAITTTLPNAVDIGTAHTMHTTPAHGCTSG